MNKIGLTDNQEIVSYENEGTKKKIGSSFYRGKNINLNPYLSDRENKNFIEKYLLKGLIPSVKPIAKSTKITAFGSCFAENITKHLTSRGYSLSKNQDPNIYISSMGEGMVNVHAILQQFKWALENEEIPQGLWHNSSTQEFELDEKIRAKTREVFLKTEFFIITLGLSEIWYDDETGGVFWRAVPVSKFDEKKHRFRVATFLETKDALQRIIDIIQKHNPRAKVLFTLSPVPLAATFRDVCCISANSASKAILRAALDEVFRENLRDFNDKLFYFPSYEIVNELFAFKYCEDGRHPRKEIVDFITSLFENTFCNIEDKKNEDIHEMYCSATNQNMAAASNPSSKYTSSQVCSLDSQIRTENINHPLLGSETEIVRQLYRGLLNREPDKSGHAAFVSLLKNSRSLESVLKLFLKSDELWNVILKENSQKMLMQIIHSLGFLVPIESKILDYKKRIALGDWGGVINELENTNSELDEIKILFKFYNSNYGRNPNNDELAIYLQKNINLIELKKTSLEISLKKSDCRVLLVGAYGNGNLGDVYQALALKRRIQERYKILDSNIYAASYNEVVSYPFPENKKIKKAELFNFNLINSFDFIVIGGGGLLACPHPPLRDIDAWVNNVHIPIIVYAVGATGAVVSECKNLVTAAVEISGRDKDSVDAIRDFRGEVQIIEDPIADESVLKALEEYDFSTEHDHDSFNSLWILKFPITDDDIELFILLNQYPEIFKNKEHRIVAIEPLLDRRLDEWFPNIVTYTAEIKTLNNLINNSKKVFSMRYHGAILSLKHNKPTLGFSQIKIKSILRNPNDYICREKIKDLVELMDLH